jgi:hypothetical protein
MPRLVRKWGRLFAQTGIFSREFAYFAVVTQPHRFSPRYAGLGEKLFTKSVIPSIEKSHSVMVN